MKLESLKSRLNNQKNRQISEKITKSDTTFNENKANFKSIKIGVSPFKKRKYEILSAWRSKKQTQYKPNLKPIYVNAIIGLSSFMTSKYVKFEDSAAKNQTQTNPIFILDVSSLGFLSGDKAI